MADSLLWNNADGRMGLADWFDGGMASQTQHLGSGWLLQFELFIGQGLVELQLHDIQGDVVLFLRPLNLSLFWKIDVIVFLVFSITNVRDQNALFVVDELPMRLQIGAAEDDLPGQEPAHFSLPHHDDLTIR